MVQRKCECVCTEVAHPAHRFNNEAVGLFVHIDHTEAVKNLWVGGVSSVCMGSWIVGLSAVPAVSPWTLRHLQYVKNAWQE